MKFSNKIKSFVSDKKLLTTNQVKKLYRDYPEIDDPGYPKTLVFSSPDKNENTILQMEIGGKTYFVVSSPVTGHDVWYRL
ncbi:hypothetical protein KKG81_10750 [bacterium]|nr:hypothetical protein [bacterium]